MIDATSRFAIRRRTSMPSAVQWLDDTGDLDPSLPAPLPPGEGRLAGICFIVLAIIFMVTAVVLWFNGVRYHDAEDAFLGAISLGLMVLFGLLSALYLLSVHSENRMR